MKEILYRNPRRKRILTPVDSANARYRDIKPACPCVLTSAAGFRKWQGEFRAIVTRLLGRMPDPVPLRPEIVERKIFPSYVREKLFFDAEKYMSVPAYVCYPTARKPGQRFPAILCCHGHGLGKNPLVGLDANRKPIKEYHKQIAARLAEHGFVTLTLDWRAFGERAERPERNGYPQDPCNLTGLVMHRLGFVLQGLNLWDAMRAIDYLQTRQDVIPDRIGCTGLSLGGTMATLIGAMDQRVVATCIAGGIGKAPTGTKFSIGSIVECGSQLIPGFANYGEYYVDLGALICPRVAQIHCGRYDSCSIGSMQINAFNHLKRAYRVAGAEDNIELDLFDGVHEYNVPSAVNFFSRRLRSLSDFTC